MTSAYRRTVGDVVMLNPFNVLGLGSAGFNPLDTLDPKSPNFYDDAAALGEALIKIEGKDPHWSESAQGLLVALIMWEKLKNGARANLENVRALLTEADTWERYTGEDGKVRERQTGGLRVTAADMIAEGGYEIASLAARFAEQTNELSSIRSTADTQTRWILSEPMRDDLKKPGVDFSKLKEKPTTVYVILPAERMRTHSVWLRLVIVSALRALYRPGGLRTLLLIDEMPALGHLGPLGRRLRPRARLQGANRRNLPRLGAAQGALQGALGILPRQCRRRAGLHAERSDDGGLDVAPRRTDDARRRKFEPKPVSPEGRRERKHELATGRARALSAAGTHGLRRRLRPALSRGHGERRPLLRPALLENRRNARAAPGAIPIMTADRANCLHTKVVKPDLE